MDYSSETSSLRARSTLGAFFRPMPFLSSFDSVPPAPSKATTLAEIESGSMTVLSQLPRIYAQQLESPSSRFDVVDGSYARVFRGINPS